jgi:hypothetical protein
MHKLWEALNRAGIVWGAFWFTVWVAGSLLLRGAASLLMKLGIPEVNAVLVPLTAKIDVGVGVALQGVVWVLTFPLKGFEGVSGVWGFIGASLVSTLSLFFVLFVLTLVVAGAEAWKNFVVNGSALVVNATKHGVDAAQDLAVQKANEATFRALQALVTKYPALNGLPRTAGALPMPSAPPAPIALSNAEPPAMPQRGSTFVRNGDGGRDAIPAFGRAAVVRTDGARRGDCRCLSARRVRRLAGSPFGAIASPAACCRSRNTATSGSGVDTAIAAAIARAAALHPRGIIGVAALPERWRRPHG